MANDNKQLAALNSVKALVEASKGAIASRLPKHLTADRIIKVALTAVNKNPDLLKCTRESLILSIMQAAELGLEPGGALGEGYLIPYNNRVKTDGGDTWVKQCQFIPGYRGLIALARRSGQIVSIEAHVVHEKDSFDCTLGLEPKLEHTPAWEDADPGPLKFVYAVAKLKDGGVQFDVMSRAAIEGIRQRSKSKDSGPWKTDYEEMARKTVIRRLFKYLPVSVELAQALELQANSESGEFTATTIDGEILDALPSGHQAPTLPEATQESNSVGAEGLKEAIKNARTREAEPHSVTATKPNGHDTSDADFFAN